MNKARARYIKRRYDNRSTQRTLEHRFAMISEKFDKIAEEMEVRQANQAASIMAVHQALQARVDEQEYRRRSADFKILSSQHPHWWNWRI